MYLKTLYYAPIKLEGLENVYRFFQYLGKFGQFLYYKI